MQIFAFAASCSDVGTVRIILQVLFNDSPEGFELGALHLKGFVDDSVWQTALQIDL